MFLCIFKTANFIIRNWSYNFPLGLSWSYWKKTCFLHRIESILIKILELFLASIISKSRGFCSCCYVDLDINISNNLSFKINSSNYRRRLKTLTLKSLNDETFDWEFISTYNIFLPRIINKNQLWCWKISGNTFVIL